MRVVIRTPDPATRALVAERLRPASGRRPPHAAEVRYAIEVGRGGPVTLHRRAHGVAAPVRVAATEDVPALLDALESDVHFQVATAASPEVFVHAGVVGWRGRAILIPGRSMSGKSSLVLALVRCGATYYSDEYAVLGRTGRVRPYPKALTLRTVGDGKTSPIETRDPGAPPAIPVRLVVVTAYRSGARWRARRLTAGEAALALIDNTVAVRARPRAALAAVSRAVAGALAIASPRDEAVRVAPLLLRRLDAWARGERAPLTRPGGAGRMRRSPAGPRARGGV